ncbi:MAG: hypothetical protein RL722_1229, partial [Pseudomonadota bacterium]|jgi:choline dehydrogenase-like flavoprotein
VAGGAINTPALLLRSGLPDPHGQLGRRTFLHPVVISAAVYGEAVAGWEGAPQTLYSDHDLHTQALDGDIGFKLEVAPLHPLIAATTLTGFGPEHAALLAELPRTQAMIALLRDGFHRESPGGRVGLRSDGTPLLDYPLTPYVMAGARRALRRMAEIQFAAGARTVLPVHEQARPSASWAQAQRQIDALAMQPLQAKVVSAHVMGGCAMAGDAAGGVLRPDGRHWQIRNLSVHDGAIFPTSIGANPQLSIYGWVNRLATELAVALGGRAVSLAA